MTEAALLALVDVASELAGELQRRFGEAATRRLSTLRIIAEGRKVSIACGRDDDRRGGTTAARGAAATLQVEAVGSDQFLFSLHARSRRGLRPAPPRADRQRVVEVVDAFLCDVAEREAKPAERSKYAPRGSHLDPRRAS